jgi:hypothetical protein
MGMTFTCSRCGETHDLPMSFALEAPVYWYGIPEDERPRRAVLDEELCAIDGQHFFIKGRICIPVHDCPDPFVWVVWVSLSGANFKRAVAAWEQADRETEPPYFGWLSSQISCYPSTLNLKTNVHTRPPGERPIIELEPTDHPLAVEQRTGITLARVHEIVETVLHT